ncbi:MAG: hypothetical protein Q9208_002426 [Pyrenodesmia sp. 3 TL-2023]
MSSRNPGKSSRAGRNDPTPAVEFHRHHRHNPCEQSRYFGFKCVYKPLVLHFILVFIIGINHDLLGIRQQGHTAGGSGNSNCGAKFFQLVAWRMDFCGKDPEQPTRKAKVPGITQTSRERQRTQ